jgi:predicted nuclease with RNAse H fold
VITAGVDLSSQAPKTAACVISWDDREATVASLCVGVDDDTITGLVARADKLGIDVPLGWPIAFAEAITEHSRGGSWPGSYLHADTTAVRYRATDLWVWKNLPMRPPLSVSTDRIALPAMRAAALLSRLPEHVARDGSGVVVEVYPAAALTRWELASQGYKGKDKRLARQDLVIGLLAKTSRWLRISDAGADLCISSDDAFDALIACLVARAAAIGMVEEIPDADRAAAEREGWIAVPLGGSLAQLAAGR